MHVTITVCGTWDLEELDNDPSSLSEGIGRLLSIAAGWRPPAGWSLRCIELAPEAPRSVLISLYLVHLGTLKILRLWSCVSLRLAADRGGSEMLARFMDDELISIYRRATGSKDGSEE